MIVHRIMSWLINNDTRPRYCFGAHVEDDLVCKHCAGCTRIRECTRTSVDLMGKHGILKDFICWIRNK